MLETIVLTTKICSLQVFAFPLMLNQYLDGKSRVGMSEEVGKKNYNTRTEEINNILI